MLSKRREQNKQDASNVQCQKCLQMGHYTYQCKNERVFVTRPSRSKQMKENLKQKRTSSSSNESDSDDYAPPPTYNARGVDTFRFKLDRAHHIVNKKEKGRKISDKEVRRKRRRHSSPSSTSSDESSITSSSSESSSSAYSSYSSSSDPDEANTKPLDRYGKKRRRSHKSDRTTARNDQSKSTFTKHKKEIDYKRRKRRSPTPSSPIERIESFRRRSLSPPSLKSQSNLTQDSL